MLKLYKRIDGVLHYHEAWCNDGTVTEHCGVVGEEGESREHVVLAGEDEESAILRYLQSATANGYAPIDVEDHAILLIEYLVEGFGTSADLDKRHSLQDRMDEILGWTGLGACDGGSIGSGTMEACCYVVDFAVAKRVIEANLAGTDFSDFTRIYNESEEA